MIKNPPKKRATDPKDKWLWITPSTFQEMAEIRGNEHPLGHFTCDNCFLVSKCSLAFDDYNTNDDCLYSK